MNGQMMQLPLLISSLITHAERHHPEQEVISRRVEGDIHRSTYKEIAGRSRRVANALAALGVQQGERVQNALHCTSFNIVADCETECGR